jgi:hypothetical protein
MKLTPDSVPFLDLTRTRPRAASPSPKRTLPRLLIECACIALISAALTLAFLFR